MLLRPYAGRNGDELVLLVVLVTCRSASTSISPPSARRRCKKQHCSSCAPSLLYLAGLPCLVLSCLLTETARARPTSKQASKPTARRRRLRGRLVECWDNSHAVCRRSSSREHSQTAYSGAWGAKRALERAACWLAFHFPPPLLLLPAPSFVIRLAARALQPLHPPSRLASNATHTQPRPHPRLHLPRCSSARSQRPLRALHTAPHCTAPPSTPSPPPCARLQLSSTRVRRRRQQREAQTVCVRPRASSYFTFAATAPGRFQRHWRVN